MSTKDKIKEREEFLKEEKEEREEEIQYKIDAWITRIEILALIIVLSMKNYGWYLCRRWIHVL